MLLAASSEAPATWLERLCVVSAVRVNEPAACSSWPAEVETLETIDPTAASNSSAKWISSARRATCGLALLLTGGSIPFGLGERLHFELLHGRGHVAKLVLPPEPRQHDVEIAGGEFAHRLAHFDHRPRNAAPEQ